VLRLARLAVDESASGQGLGTQLLRFVLKLAVRMANDYGCGCVGVGVDAKRDAVDFYAKYGFMPADAVEGRSDVRPHPTTMFLSMRAIEGGAG
jgi:GNAT superfamily N-acetyltransferase